MILYHGSNSFIVKLCDEYTGLYKESSSYIYELLKDEIEDGCLKQKEI